MVAMMTHNYVYPPLCVCLVHTQLEVPYSLDCQQISLIVVLNYSLDY